MRGKVQFFDDRRGFGKILPDDGSEAVFVHCSCLPQGIEALLEGEPVEFDCINDPEKGPQARNLIRLEARLAGDVIQFENGYGHIQPSDGSAPIFVHHSNIIGVGYKRLEHGETVEFSIGTTDRGPQAIRVKRMDTRPPLERFAYLRNVDKVTTDLAALAQRENWGYREAASTRPNPVLRSFLYYTFARIEEEGKIATAVDGSNKRVACFNTGLVTERQEPIFGFFVEPRTETPRNEPWLFASFCKESDRQLVHFASRPDTANYFSEPSELLYDTRVELVVDVDHIIGDNIERFPEALRTNEYALRGALDGAVISAKKRVRRNYKAAIPDLLT